MRFPAMILLLLLIIGSGLAGCANGAAQGKAGLSGNDDPQRFCDWPLENGRCNLHYGRVL